MTRLLRSLLVIMLMTFATGAQALAPCGETVVDTVGVLKDISSVQAAAAKLANDTGAEIRVRISADFGKHPNLDAYVNEVKTNVCWAWSIDQGAIRGDFIVIWIATEREDIGFYYGSQWSSRMLPKEDAIFDAMIPALLDPDNRDYDEALRDGLEQIALVLAPKSETPRVSEPVLRVPAPTPPAVVPTVTRDPVDTKPFLILIAFIISAIVLTVIAKNVVNQRTEKQRQEEERQTAKRAAVTVYNEVGEVSLTAGNTITRTEKALVDVEALSSPEQIANWQGQLRELKDEVEVLRGKHNAPPTDPREEHTLAAYTDAKNAFADLLPIYESARDKLTNLAQEIEGIPALAKAMPEELEKLQREVAASVGQIIANCKRDGFNITGPDNIYKAGEEIVRQMRGAIDSRNWNIASGHLAEARIKFNEAKVVAESLPLRRQEATERLAALRKQFESFSERKGAADKAMDVMAVQFTKDSYSLVVGNDTKAVQLYDELTSGLSALEQLITSQEWDTVDARLESSEDDWADIDDLFTAITDRLLRLQQMILDADAELAEAKRSVAAAEEYLTAQPKYDTLDNRSVVAKLQSDLNQVPQQKKGKRFSVVEQLRQATAIDDAADAFLAQIEARVADDAARVVRAERLMRDIGVRITEYDRYAMLHRGDIPVAIIDNLTNARENYGTLEQLRNVDEQLKKGTAVNLMLDTFHRAAKLAVAKAEADRTRVREEAEATERRRHDAEQKRADEARRQQEDDDADGPGPFGSSGGLIGIPSASTRPSRSSYGGSRSYGSGSGGSGGGSRSFGISSSGMGGGSRSFGSSSKMGGGSRSFSR